MAFEWNILFLSELLMDRLCSKTYLELLKSEILLNGHWQTQNGKSVPLPSVRQQEQEMDKAWIPIKAVTKVPRVYGKIVIKKKKNSYDCFLPSDSCWLWSTDHLLLRYEAHSLAGGISVCRWQRHGSATIMPIHVYIQFTLVTGSCFKNSASMKKRLIPRILEEKHLLFLSRRTCSIQIMCWWP